MILVFWMLSFQPTFSLSSQTPTSPKHPQYHKKKKTLGNGKKLPTHAQLCPAFCNLIDCSLPNSSPRFSRQECWSGLPFPLPGEPSKSRDRTHGSRVPCIGRRILYHWSTLITRPMAHMVVFWTPCAENVVRCSVCLSEIFSLGESPCSLSLWPYKVGIRGNSSLLRLCSFKDTYFQR